MTLNRAPRIRFVTPGPAGMPSVERVFRNILEPIYGCQDEALNKLREGVDRACRVAFDTGSDPAVARGMIVYKTAPTPENAPRGPRRSFEIMAFLLKKGSVGVDYGVDYGTEMVKFAASKAAECGALTMHISVTKRATMSLEFFERRGFRLDASGEGLGGSRFFLMVASLAPGPPPRAVKRPREAEGPGDAVRPEEAARIPEEAARIPGEAERIPGEAERFPGAFGARPFASSHAASKGLIKIIPLFICSGGAPSTKSSLYFSSGLPR